MMCLRLATGLAFLGLLASGVLAAEMPRIAISSDGRGFVTMPGDKPFTPYGFNYDHDEQSRLLEDYWHDEWDKVAADFREMKELGANVVRIHLQTGKFLDAADKPNEASLRQLARLVKLAEEVEIYLDVTGLGCYHKQDVPAWYDELSEQDRWKAQGVFWKAVAEVCRESPAIFCYDLMNEPVAPAGERKGGDWLGPGFAGKHFVQRISLDRAGRQRHEIAKAWIDLLVGEIRSVDKRALVTVGMVDWSLDRPGLTSGFVPDKVSENLDFLAVHVYPDKEKLEEARKTVEGFAAVGKPLIVEETFPLKCSIEQLSTFMKESRGEVSGWISFYWGKTPEELAQSDKLGDAILLAWLKEFGKHRPR